MPINSREKGKRGERLLSKRLNDYGYKTRRTSQYCGNTGDAADLVNLPGIHVEVKFVEKLNLVDAVDQAVRDTKDDKLPTVFHKKSRTDWYVTQRLDDWIQLYREWEAGRQDNG